MVSSELPFIDWETRELISFVRSRRSCEWITWIVVYDQCGRRIGTYWNRGSSTERIGINRAFFRVRLGSLASLNKLMLMRYRLLRKSTVHQAYGYSFERVSLSPTLLSAVPIK